MSGAYGSGSAGTAVSAKSLLGRSDGPGAVLSLIRERGGATRRDLLLATNLARATIESRLDRLVAHGFVVAREVPIAAGRPPQMFHFNHAGGYLLCIDMGSTQTRLGITDLSGRLSAYVSADLDLSMGPGVALGKVGTLLRTMIRKERIDPGLVMGVGVGVPSHVELTGHMVRPPFEAQATTLASWTGMVISQEIRAFLPALGIGAVPVAVDKDANIMALGEWREAWPEVRDLIVLKVGMSISSAIVANSRIVRGAIGLAGDLGHIPDPTSDLVCSCGQRGCADTIASGRGISKLLGDSVGPIHASADLRRLQDSGRPEVIALVKQAGQHLGVLIGIGIAALNPQLVVVGGGLAENNALLLDEIRTVALSRVHPLTAATTNIVAAQISAASGLYGAAHLVLREVLDPSAVDQAIERGMKLSVHQGS
ncbi:MAG: ROK family protein [Candidatus Nanopelagicales bacterium]